MNPRPWVFWLLLAAVVFPPANQIVANRSSPNAPAESAGTSAKPAMTVSGGATGASGGSRREVDLPLLGWFIERGVASPNGSNGVTFAAGSKVLPLVVMVPDPLESGLPAQFDLAVDAIQRAFAVEGWLLDRLWLPWPRSKPDDPLHHRRPGLLLLHKKEAPSVLAAVFLVGETARQGAHPEALQVALEAAQALAPKSPLRVAGPYFSGSAASLGRALIGSKQKPWVVTGSATASRLAEQIAAAARMQEIQFERTINEDVILTKAALEFLTKSLGWDEDQIALLVEADTAYGQGFKLCDVSPLMVQFPGRLSPLRATLEGPREGAQTQRAELPGLAPVLPQLHALDLKGATPARDEVPTFSTLTAAVDDLAMATLLDAVSREGIRYVGLLATDPLDKIYLAQRLRQLAPDLLLFTFDNQLLYAHPQVAQVMNGTLVIGSYPLVAETPLKTQTEKDRQVLGAETQAGLLYAVRRLLQEPNEVAPVAAEGWAWVVAVGNGAMWPIATLDLAQSQGSRPLPSPPGEIYSVRSVSAQIALLVLVVVAAYLLLHAMPPSQALLSANEGLASTRWLLAGGLGLVTTTGWLILLLASVPFRLTRWAIFDGWPLICAAAAALVMALVARLFQSTPRTRQGLKELPGGPWVWCFLAIPGLAAIGGGMLELWTAHSVDPRYFYLRATSVTSGLSPVIPLASLAVGLYTYALIELRRRRLAARHHISWPLPCQLPMASALRKRADDLEPLLSGRESSPGERRFRKRFLVVLVAIFGALVWVFRPLAESRSHGWLFLGLVFVLIAAGGWNWFEFLSLWRRTLGLLRELHSVEWLQKRLREPEIRNAIAWKPARSFAWSMPRLQLAQLVLDGLAQLPNCNPQALDTLRVKLTKAEESGDLGTEVVARQELGRWFDEATRGVTTTALSDSMKDLILYRLAAYLRYAFEVLRYRLLVTLPIGITTLTAVSLYNYHPRYLLTVIVSLAVAGTAATAAWAFLQMERDPILSAFAGTTEGKVEPGGWLISNLVSYVGIPLLALLASRIPGIGDLLLKLGNPLLRAVGGGN